MNRTFSPSSSSALAGKRPLQRRLGSWFAVALIGSAFLLAETTAMAAKYETFVDISTEDELFDLNIAGEISSETFETLVELLRRGVDLNTASRDELFTLPNLSYADVDAIIAYRQESGAIDDPAELVTAGVLDEALLSSIAAFIIVTDPSRKARLTRGYVRHQTFWSQADVRVPAMVLDGEIRTAKHLEIGFVGALSRNRIGNVRFDPQRQALTARGQHPQVHLPKFYLQWDTDNYGIIAGTYRIGFGQRLTFDNTRSYTPNGFYRDRVFYRGIDLTRLCNESTGELFESPCAGEAGDIYVTPDFRWQETLQGVAAGAKHIKVPVGWLQAYGFFSYQNRDIYQYKIYNKDTCDDPRNDDDPACAAPPVFKQQDDLLAQTSQLSFETLPNMYRELTAGGNFSYFINRRSHIGITGYGSHIDWNVKGMNLDFQEWDPRPFGGPYGAVGIDGAWGMGWSDLELEVSRSFDSMAKVTGSDGGGGFAGIIRHTATWEGKNAKVRNDHEIETILRYYDPNYANPYARPFASQDQLDGSRARDEFGGRIRYTGRIAKKLNLRGFVNVWTTASFKIPQILTRVQAEYKVSSWFTPGFWALYQNKDLNVSGRGQCFGGDPSTNDIISGNDVGVDADLSDFIVFGDDGLTEPPPRCSGEQIRLDVFSKFIPHKRVSITPRYQHRWVDDQAYEDRMRQDIQAWLTLQSRPIDDLSLRLRIRYLYQDILDNERYEQSLWNYVDIGYLIKKTFLISLRYDLYVWLDQRENTLLRQPSPENRLLLQLEGRF